MSLLNKIQDDFNSIKTLSDSELNTLTEELRETLIQSLNQSGGHFAANLGCVELAIACHHCYNTPHDNLIWDVGHQAYPHKILTGRLSDIHRIRQTNGPAPFPTRTESDFDAFGTGHSSTSISAALGMALADTAKDKHHIAIIGDGAMTAGIAFEALNHAGTTKAPLTIILNDNNMSISNNVGALSIYLSKILNSRMANQLLKTSKAILSYQPTLRHMAKRIFSQVKGLIVPPSTLFEELGIHYIGPINGHDITELTRTLKQAKTLSGPTLIHVITQKGHGYAPAEADPIAFHSVSPGFLSQSTPKTSSALPTYSNIFGQWLCHAAEENEHVMGITPAMKEGSDLIDFASKYPDRYFDVGIAEQHAVTLAAGMACEGARPVVAIYASFLQRAYDQLIHDVALQSLPVIFAIDRACLVPDGPTHAGQFDISFLRCIPNLLLMAPHTAQETWAMLNTGLTHTGPSAVRYPRGHAAGHVYDKAATLPIGKSQCLRQGERVAFLAFGSAVERALSLAESVNATVINMRFIKPLDTQQLDELKNNHTHFFTFEDNAIAGGAGSAVAEYYHRAHPDHPMHLEHFGYIDAFFDHGDMTHLDSQAGVSLSTLRQRIDDALSSSPKPLVEPSSFPFNKTAFYEHNNNT